MGVPSGSRRRKQLPSPGDGELLVRHFIRADVFTSMDEALDCTFRKPRQSIDQNGPSLFDDWEKSRST